MPEKIYDWDKLKNDWFLSDEVSLSAFLESAIGKRPDSDGNVNEHTKGWIAEKKEYKRRLAEEAEKEIREKLKIRLQDLLLAKKRSYELIGKYVEYYAKILAGEEITKEEKDFIAKFSIKGGIDTVIKWIQIELGLPTNIAELQGSKEKPINLITLLREADEILKNENAEYAGSQKDTSGNTHQSD